MELGLLVELSSSERATLRDVAFGIAETNLPTANVERLKALALVESKNQQLVLTELGRRNLLRFLATNHSSIQTVSSSRS